MPDQVADTVRVVAFWLAPPGGADRIRAILGELATATRREPGCRRFEVLEATEPGRFVLLEEYAGAAGRAAHLDSAHFRRLVLEVAVPLLFDRRVDAYHPIHEPGETGHEPGDTQEQSGK